MANTFVICASASSYRRVIDACKDFDALGIRFVLPKTAEKMRSAGDANIEAVTDWSAAPDGYHGKSLLIREHFKEIEKGDALLVMNYEKHGIDNYIGPNVLMEMSTAFYLGKPIYVLNGKPDGSPLIDEILALEPVFLNGDVSQLTE